MELKDRPLAERQEKILVYLHSRRHVVAAPSASAIAYAIGMGKLPIIHCNHGRGATARAMNPAQRILSSLTGLQRRGLIYPTTDYGYELTQAGERKAQELV